MFSVILPIAREVPHATLTGAMPNFDISRLLSEYLHEHIDIQYLFGPQIDGVEVTQALQYYNADQHLTDPADRGPDNSVRLVANKPAWVRVYLRTFFGTEIPNVTGEVLVLRRQTIFGPYLPTRTISPQGTGRATAVRVANYATERGSLSATLNFILPAEEMYGFTRIAVRIWAASNPASVRTRNVDLDATLLQTLRLRGIFISYNGQNANGTGTLNLPAPTLANMQTTAAYTLTVDPVESVGNFSSGGTLAWSTPLTGVATQPGGCSIQWLQLNAAVAQVKANDGNRTDFIYYGLLPAGVPIANVGGCESSGVSTGPNGAGVTMAHEVGHGAGLRHGPCGTTSGDPNYPAYEPYDTVANRTARIGEYGLNINNGSIFPPANSPDYMSYCLSPLNWISLYHHARLINNAAFNPRTVGVHIFHVPDLVDPWLWPWEYIPDPGPIEKNGNPWTQKAQPVISIIGLINERHEIEVLSVMHVTALPHLGGARRTTMKVELLDRENRPIAEAPIMQLTSQGDGCGCCGGGEKENETADERGPFLFQALLSDVKPGAKLRITRAEEKGEPREVWSRTAPERPPSVSHFEIQVREGHGYAQWRVEKGSGELDFSLQFSKDEGRSWNSLAVAVTGNEHRFELANLPSGEVLFALLAHDGFHTTRIVSKAVDLPCRASTVSILHPIEGDTLVAEQTLRLWGAVSTSTGKRIEDRACRWLIDGHEAGHGLEIWTTTPDAGEHRCTLVVEDEGGRVETSVTFRSLAADGDPREKYEV